MALKYKLKSKDEAPAELANLYVERDGVFVLDVEGAVDKAKLDEFRTTNVALLKERDELKQRFEGIDPEAVRQLAAEKQRLEEERQLKAGEIEKVIEARSKSLKADFDKQLASVAAERDALNARLATVQIDQAAVAAATRRGLRSTALADLTARARGVFKLSNGLPTAYEPDGSTVRTGKDGINPMTLEEWVDALVSDAPHLFESNAGGGSGNNNGAGGAGMRGMGKNPFRRETWNLTEQMRIQKGDPGLAARLKAAA
ncbi:hypothetical protein GC207_13600 [bacterium]|nr:hypothetical protein [bacterium]